MNSTSHRPHSKSLPFETSPLLSDAPGEITAFDIFVAEMLAGAEPVFQLIYRYWNALRGDRAMCSRADIDPIDIRDTLTHLVLVDVVREPFDCVIRLAGSDVEHGAGFALTNLALSQIWISRDAFVFGEYERVAAGRNPRMSISVCKNAHQVLKKVSRLLCPLSTEGVGVEAILGAVIFENAAY